jgi:hypothetical protein
MQAKSIGTDRGLESIPGIGPALVQDLRLIGVDRPSCLKGKDPEKLYKKLERLTGVHQDRCVLYTFRCAVYYVNTKEHNLDLLKWWNWSDENMRRRALTHVS